MTDHKQSSFNMLVDLTRDQTDKAGGKLNQLVTERRGAEQQLAMLKEYRQDYADRLNHAGQTGITASNYHNFTRFLATLDQAILQQTKIMAHLDHNIDVSTDHWRTARRRLHSYETLQTRQRQHDLAVENRREQLACDEMSATMHRRAHSGRGPL